MMPFDLIAYNLEKWGYKITNLMSDVSECEFEGEKSVEIQ